MKIVKLECPSCKANLEFNNELENIRCNYCGTKIIIEDTNQTKIERTIRTIGKEIEKNRNYYNSNEYKERLEIQHKNNKKQIKLLGIIFLGFFIVMTLIILLANLID